MCPSRRRSPLDSSDGTSPHVAGDLLRAYPPMSQAKWAHVESSVNLDASGNPDPYFMSIDLATASHPQTLLATHFNGEPLTVENGAPLRLLMPVKLGLKNVKAITGITYVAEEPRDYWAERGYSRYVIHWTSQSAIFLSPS
jgi:DMSO/TMAO reductase YedYZ molybdopterin-dependent catalytic subunit